MNKSMERRRLAGIREVNIQYSVRNAQLTSGGEDRKIENETFNIFKSCLWSAGIREGLYSAKKEDLFPGNT